MPEYEVVATTGNRLLATTFDYVYIKLVGTDGQSQRKALSTKDSVSLIIF